VDGDGDQTASQTLNVTLEGSNTFTGTASADTIQGSSGNDSLTGNGGNDLFVLKSTLATNGHDTISDFNAGDLILVDVASQNLTINTSTLAAFTTATDATQAAAWNGSANQFVFNTQHNELYYSADGTAAHAIDLAQIATGVPAPTAIHTF
jgi:Ca2+-binding RTX toxin-like protein